MFSPSKKRRGLCALLTLIAAFGLATLGAGSASADDLVTASVTGCAKEGKGEVAITNPTPDEARVEVNRSLVATLAGGKSETVEVSVPGSMTLSWNVQGKGNYGGELVFKPCSVPTQTPSDTPHPTPTPTPEPTPEPSPEPTPERSPEPVTSTVPGTTRTVVVSPAPVVKKVVPPATAGRNGVTDDGSWALVVLGLGLLLFVGVLKYRRPHTGRRH